MTTTEAPRLMTQFRSDVLPGLMKDHEIKNVHQAPALKKIVVSMGVGLAREDKARMEAALADLTAITGQKPTTRKARKSVSNFKLREGMEIGAMVTLRGARMWEFLDRLVTIAIPRIKDFRGLKSKLDGRGNYSVGLTDQTIFPEVDLDRVKNLQGMNITFVTSTDSDAVALDMLKRLGVPFQRDDDKA